jgi:alpha-beta hydrolase superfamily lysophospholipase
MSEQELVLPTAWGQLSGTLLLPDSPAPYPAALLVGGAGPTDRDGNNAMLNARIENLRRLAQALAARGIASLRYDKRGVGASTYPGLSEQQLRFEHLVDDAVALAERLASDPRIGRIVLVGHSEGALIAALAAEDAGAQAVVSISGAGSRASSLMRRQLQAQLPDELAAPALAALDALEAQQPVPDVNDDLFLLFRPTVQPYLMSWFRHDPPAVLADLPLPVLLVHGSADPQLGEEHARWLQAGKPDARLEIVNGLDHMISVGGDTARGADVVAATVAQWLQEVGVGVSA